MFSDIEKEYKKGLPELRFRSYYVRLAVPLMVAAYLASKFLRINSWVTTIVMGALLLVLVIIYLLRDIHNLSPRRKGMGLKAWLVDYNNADEVRRRTSLIVSLRKNNFKTRDDLKLALDHFEQQIPTPSKPSALELILSAAVGLMSLVVLAYDEESGVVNFSKFWSILWPTLGVALMILVPVFLIGYLVKKMIYSHTKIEVILVEDLAYIYINFDKLRTQLAV